MPYIVNLKRKGVLTGERWLIESMVSMKAACNAISFARVTGSVGTTFTTRNVTAPGEGIEVITAKVYKIDKDGNPIKPS